MAQATLAPSILKHLFQNGGIGPELNEDIVPAVHSSTTEKLSNPQTIILKGDTVGTVTFDGTEDATLQTTTNTATQLRDARNISLSGDATGDLETNFDGTEDVTINATVTTATKLRNAQKFSLTGDVTASEISFDGTGAVALSTTIKSSVLPGDMVPKWSSRTGNRTIGTDYTPSTDGYLIVIQSNAGAQNYDANILINGTQYAYQRAGGYGSWQYSGNTCVYPIKANDTYRVTGTATYVYFLPTA